MARMTADELNKLETELKAAAAMQRSVSEVRALCDKASRLIPELWQAWTDANEAQLLAKSALADAALMKKERDGSNADVLLAQTLLSEILTNGALQGEGVWAEWRQRAEAILWDDNSELSPEDLQRIDRARTRAVTALSEDLRAVANGKDEEPKGVDRQRLRAVCISLQYVPMSPSVHVRREGHTPSGRRVVADVLNERPSSLDICSYCGVVFEDET